MNQDIAPAAAAPRRRRKTPSPPPAPRPFSVVTAPSAEEDAALLGSEADRLLAEWLDARQARKDLDRTRWVEKVNATGETPQEWSAAFSEGYRVWEPVRDREQAAKWALIRAAFGVGRRDAYRAFTLPGAATYGGYLVVCDASGTDRVDLTVLPLGSISFPKSPARGGGR